jgi:hypothetical protein
MEVLVLDLTHVIVEDIQHVCMEKDQEKEVDVEEKDKPVVLYQFAKIWEEEIAMVDQDNLWVADGLLKVVQERMVQDQHQDAIKPVQVIKQRARQEAQQREEDLQNQEKVNLVHMEVLVPDLMQVIVEDIQHALTAKEAEKAVDAEEVDKQVEEDIKQVNETFSKFQ